MSSWQWKKSGLPIGEQLILPRTQFVDSDKRLITSVLEGETDHGIFVRNEFIPGIGSEDADKWKYKRFISWESIYCGAVQVHIKSTGEMLRALRKDE